MGGKENKRVTESHTQERRGHSRSRQLKRKEELDKSPPPPLQGQSEHMVADDYQFGPQGLSNGMLREEAAYQ